MALKHHGRYPYSPIHARPDYAWPQGRRLAVYLGYNLEHFAFGEGLGAKLGPASPEPDVLNYSWRDYGNRVGAWRCLELFDELRLPAAVVANCAIYDFCPEVMAAHRKRGDEVVGHGRTNSERQGTLSAEEERALIAESTARILKEEGRAPRGWLSPWISESALTPELLKEAGYAYTLNWCHDDQPLPFATRAGALWSIPYPQEVNDIPMIVARQMGAAEFADLIIGNYEEMLAQSERQPLVMGIALHPYVVGQPYRLRELRRALARIVSDGRAWLATPGAILDHVESLELKLPASAPGTQAPR
jgi:peptidoglycan/xylan/chitin deacetylase (PgdA/CDA1 family)